MKTCNISKIEVVNYEQEIPVYDITIKKYHNFAIDGGILVHNCNYHHGDASIGSAINGLTQDFIGTNNIPMFSGKGNFGNRLIQEPAATRYTSVKLNNEFLKYFNDFDILDKNEDPENPEPKCYLPTIPWVLVNGAEGIAVGFSTYILPRDPDKLKQYIKNKITGKGSYYKFEPYFKNFKGKITKDPERNSWIMEGTFERIKSNVIRVTEVPIGFDREKYIIFLEKQIERKNIRDYEEKCKNGFEFIVKMDKKDMEDEEIITTLRLRTTLTETITVIDNEGRLREFETPDKICDYFIDYRLKKYAERIARNIQLANDEISLIDEKKMFIEIVIGGKFNITKVSKQELIIFLKTQDFVFIEQLIGMKIYQFTKDEIEKLNQKKLELVSYIKNLKQTTPEKEWCEELK
jgi:DNA topoisomerase-2